MGLDPNRDNAPFKQVFSTKAHQFFVLVGVARIFCFLFLYEQVNCNSIKKYMHILDQDKCFAGLTYRIYVFNNIKFTMYLHLSM